MNCKYHIFNGYKQKKKTRCAWFVESVESNKIGMVDAFPSKNTRKG